MSQDEFNQDEMTEVEKEESLKKFKENVAKGMCSFCGLWEKYGHAEWCKQK